MSAIWTRRLLALALLLALVVVGASSYLRLGGNGLGCDPWPACYATRAAAQDFNSGVAARSVRMAHRVAASAFFFVALLVVASAWRRWSSAQRRAGVAVLVVTTLLAAIGPLTPAALPWVTWSNALGGLVLVALVMVLWQAARRTTRGWARGAALVLTLLLAQALSGVLLSVRLARSGCVPECSAAAGGSVPALLDPVRAGSAFAITGSPKAGTAMQVAHWLTGLALLGLLVGYVASAPAGVRVYPVALGTGAVFVLGSLQTELARPALGATHAMAAALLLGCCALALRRSYSVEPHRHKDRGAA
jgi:cytochrome c oxidase assembly protein subunit 15